MISDVLKEAAKKERAMIEAKRPVRQLVEVESLTASMLLVWGEFHSGCGQLNSRLGNYWGKILAVFYLFCYQ